MGNSLSASAQKVQDALTGMGIAAEVVELPSSTRTAQEAADSVGGTVEQIVKSLVFRTRETGRPVLVLASGVNRVNEKMLSARVGEAVEKADADFVRAATGFAIGGVPPVGHAAPLHTVIDADLFALDELWAAAGTPNAVFRLTGSDLKTLATGSGAVVAQIQETK